MPYKPARSHKLSCVSYHALGGHRQSAACSQAVHGEAAQRRSAAAGTSMLTLPEVPLTLDLGATGRMRLVRWKAVNC